MFIGFLLCAFCQNCAVAVRDIKELEGVVSALGKFTRELERKKRLYITQLENNTCHYTHLSIQ